MSHNATTPPDFTERHPFVRYKQTEYCGTQGRYGARCGLREHDPVHLSDDVEGDRFVPIASDEKAYTATDFTEQVGTVASWEDEARRLLTACCYVINGLADQQAMPDNSYEQFLKSVGDFLQQPPVPAEHPQQDWCDHCSGDLEQPVPEVKGRTTTHVICERCYRKLAGPRWFDPDFDPTKGSPETLWLTEQARQLLSGIEREAVNVYPLFAPNPELREILVRHIASFAAKAATAALERERERIKEALAQVLSQAMMERAIAIIGDDKEQQQ